MFKMRKVGTTILAVALAFGSVITASLSVPKQVYAYSDETEEISYSEVEKILSVFQDMYNSTSVYGKGYMDWTLEDMVATQDETQHAQL